MKKVIIALILMLTMAVSVLPVFAAGAENSEASKDAVLNDIGFSDISGHWAEASILKYAYPSIFEGKDGRFYPERAITRGEFAMLLHRTLNININYLKATDIKEFFNDVSNDDACSSNLYDLVIAGIIDRKDTFGPEQALPREEMIHYTLNALKYASGDNYAVIKMMPAPFDDDAKITQAFKNDIVEAVLLKLVYGRGHNLLYPQSGSTRAEAAVIVDRMMTTAGKFNTSIDVTPSAEKGDTGIKFKLSITNNSKRPVTIEQNSGQKYDFVLLDSGRNEIYRWSEGRLFTMALTTSVIDSGKTLEYTESLDGSAYGSIKDKIKYMKAYAKGKVDSFDFNPGGYEIEVR